jgi:hypothetical protein
MTDALPIANAALIKATEAMTQVNSHERECARRYHETAKEMTAIRQSLDLLVIQNAEARGKAAAVKKLVSGIPNAFWNVMISLCAGGVVAFFTILLKPH